MGHYAHMCRDGHQQIGHNDSEHERCPLCRATDAQDWIAQQLHNIVTNKSVDEWQEAMLGLADYIEARKAP